ncbi:succinate dehydrogenase cytochrome b560 subunit, mitochondrial [Cyanocitta cristata]
MSIPVSPIPYLSLFSRSQVCPCFPLSHIYPCFSPTPGVSLFSVAALLLPEPFPHYVAQLRALGPAPPLLFLAKFSLAAPFCYHGWNGIRHLAWDLGKGLRLPQVTQSGLLVLALTLLSSAALASL